jgi:hypothetical protein
VNHAGRGGPEAARIEVERRKPRLEINVQPLAPSAPGVQNGTANEFGADAPPLEVSPDLRIEQESVVTAVPSDVGKADRLPSWRWAVTHPRL